MATINISIPVRHQKKVLNFLSELDKPTKLTQSVIVKSDAILLIADITKYVNKNPKSGKSEANYEDLCHNNTFTYFGQKMKTEFDGLFHDLYTGNVRKPVLIVAKAETICYALYKVTNFRAFTARQRSTTHTSPPILEMEIEELQARSFCKVKPSSQGCGNWYTIMKHLQIHKLLNMRSGIHPITIGNEEFLAALSS